jgi:H+/Cl- antiporter ClcA
MSEPAQLSGAAYLRLVLLGAAIGIPAALVAALFLAFVHDLEHWLWTDLPDALGHSAPPWYLVVGLPVAGAALVVVARVFLPGDGGHSPLEGIKGGPVPPRNAAGIALAAVATLAFGGVLGPEAPLIALGAVVGTVVIPFVRLNEQETAVMSTAGSFSAISALFGGPLVAGVLLLEGGIGLGASLIPVLLPGFVAAAVGYLVIIGFGDWGGLDVPGLAVPSLPPYEGPHVRDMFLAAALGVVTAVLISAIRLVGLRVRDRGEARLGVPALLIGGGLAVGVLAQLADVLGANSQDVLFSGQASVPSVIAEDSAKIVLILLAAKGLAYAVCLGCGFRGGPVFPAIFLGVALATFAVIGLDASPTWAIAAGAAAGTTAMTRLLLSSMIFAALLVGLAGPAAIPAAVIASATAWLTVTALDKRSAAPGPARPGTGS